MSKMDYKSSGVNYDLLDNLKRMAQQAADTTDTNITDTNLQLYGESRGESAIVVEQENSYLTFVQEGLGTKNLVADAMMEIDGKSHYDAIAQDTVAAIVNDLITVGSRPIGVTAYWAVGSDAWLTNEARMKDLTEGWKKACDMSMAVWIGGETPTLSGIIHPETIDLGGSAFGVIDPKSQLALGEKLQIGDSIVLLESNGIHTNGLSLARKIADTLPEGYATKLFSGRMYGEALLDPTHIYVKVIQDIYAAGIEIHYMAHITGHGWRKLMRNTKPFTYRMTSVPTVPEVLQFIQHEAEMSDQDAYATFNMGAGFALFVAEKDIEQITEIANKNGIKAYLSGIVEEGEKQVIIEPKKVTFTAETLQVRV